MARLFQLVQPTLMHVPWFALWYPRWTAWKNHWLGLVRQSAAWRESRAQEAAQWQQQTELQTRSSAALATLEAELAGALDRIAQGRQLRLGAAAAFARVQPFGGTGGAPSAGTTHGGMSAGGAGRAGGLGGA